jgi:hypothetical protein
MTKSTDKYVQKRKKLLTELQNLHYERGVINSSIRKIQGELRAEDVWLITS